jgi:hypothetical protein
MGLKLGIIVYGFAEVNATAKQMSGKSVIHHVDTVELMHVRHGLESVRRTMRHVMNHLIDLILPKE